MSEETGGERPKHPKTIPIILFLLLVGAALGGWIWYSSRPFVPAASVATPAATVTRSPVATPPASTAVAAVDDIPGDGFGIVPGPATPWAVAGGPGEPTATPEQLEIEPASLAGPIVLLGPPADSFFRMGDAVTFYWSSPEPLLSGHQYTVYLLSDGAQVALGSAVEANLGNGFQLPAVPGQSVEEPGRLSWLIALEDQATGAIIGQSEVRVITLIADN